MRRHRIIGTRACVNPHFVPALALRRRSRVRHRAGARRGPAARVGRIADVAGELFLAPEDARRLGAIGLNYPVTTGRQPVGRHRGPRRDRLRRRAVPARRRHEPARFAARRSHVRAVRRAGPRDPAGARAGPGRVGARRHAEHQVVLTRPGLYRIDVSPDRQRTVSWCAKARRLAQGAVQQVLPGQTALDGAAPHLRDVRNGIATDGFDTWSANRDRRYERVRAMRHVSRQMVGAADLDEYGAGNARSTARSGSGRRRRRTGRRIAMATGPGRRLGPDVGRRGALGLRAVPLRPLGHPAAAGAGARAAMSPGRCGRRRWSAGSAGRLGCRASRAGRSTAGCRWAGASRTARVEQLLGRLLDPLQQALRGERRRGPGAADALFNATAPDAITAVPAPASPAASRSSPHRSRSARRARARRCSPHRRSAPSIRQTRGEAGHGVPPPASVVYVDAATPASRRTVAVPARRAAPAPPVRPGASGARQPATVPAPAAASNTYRQRTDLRRRRRAPPLPQPAPQPEPSRRRGCRLCRSRRPQPAAAGSASADSAAAGAAPTAQPRPAVPARRAGRSVVSAPPGPPRCPPARQRAAPSASRRAGACIGADRGGTCGCTRVAPTRPRVPRRRRRRRRYPPARRSRRTPKRPRRTNRRRRDAPADVPAK